ncbi:MAG: PAS domain S-box protein [Candidatus Zixiibacteriota bacterium]
MELSRSIEKLAAIDLTHLIRSLSDYLLLVDREGQILFINHVATAETHEEPLGRTVYDFTAESYHGDLAERLGRVFESGSRERIEVKRSDPDFAKQWWSIAMSALREDGQTRVAVFLCRDVTDLQNMKIEQQQTLNLLKRKFWKEASAHDRAREILIEEIEVRREAEQSLRASEERYRSLVENARNAIFAISYEGRFQFLNPVAARDLGGSAEDYTGKMMDELFPPEIARRQMATIQRVIKSQVAESHQALTFIGGRHKWYITSIQPLMNSDGSCTSALLESTDIDEQVRAVQQLRRERNFSNSILQTANSLIVCLDSKANITVFNGECEAVTGYSFDEVRGKSWIETFLPEESRHAGLSNFGNWVREHPHDRYEGPIITKSGEIRTIFWSNSSFVLEDTGELMAIAIGADITEMKRLEQSLFLTEARNRAVLQGLPDLVFVIDRSGLFRKYEGGIRENLLLPVDKIVGAHVSDALPPDVTETSLRLIDEAIVTGTTQECEYEVTTPTGREAFECRFARYNDEECIAIVRNVTVRKQMEKDLSDANEKLRLEHQAIIDKNTALREVLSQIERQVEGVKQRVQTNVETLLMPIISQLKQNASARDRVYADRIESMVIEISSSFARNLQKVSPNLTQREVEICNLIKNGLESKEIADLLSLSIRTVEKFRQRIRRKLGLINKDINLATYLKTLLDQLRTDCT